MCPETPVMHEPPQSTCARVKMAKANVEDDLELILSLDDTDVEIDDKTSATIQQSTSVAVLEKISSSTLKSEAEIATKILKKHS